MIDSSNAHSPNHVIKKSIRLCIDPKDLNEASEREPYYSRSIDELISMFAGAKVFTIVDMDKGYWQVVLHPESRKLTCMAFDIGRYQFKRLPMGSKVASDIFQRMLYSVYIGLPGVTGIADDMVIKAEFKKKIILPYFDRNKETILQTDASKKGFGAVILQEEQPIYYALRALTSAEKNYQNLEREAQAAVWGMEKFHYFLYGRKFILQTDQKPLVSIFRKHMIDVSPRIQRITIRAWQYGFVPQHIPGRINVIADSLSRVTPLEF